MVRRVAENVRSEWSGVLVRESDDAGGLVGWGGAGHELNEGAHLLADAAEPVLHAEHVGVLEIGLNGELIGGGGRKHSAVHAGAEIGEDEPYGPREAALIGERCDREVARQTRGEHP